MELSAAILAIAGTLLGVMVTSLTTAANERKKREAEDKRELNRNQREDAAEKRLASAKEREADAAAAEMVASLLHDGRNFVTSFDRNEDGIFTEYFEGKLDGEFVKKLRMLIGSIRDEEARKRLVTVMDALLDFLPLTAFSGSESEERFLSDSLILGAELAMAIARGQKPEAKFITEHEALRKHVDAWDKFLDEQADKRSKVERARLQTGAA